MEDSGNEDDLVAGPMDIDDSSRTQQKPRGPPGDHDMNEVADILLNMNVNLNGRSKRWAMCMKIESLQCTEADAGVASLASSALTTKVHLHATFKRCDGSNQMWHR